MQSTKMILNRPTPICPQKLLQIHVNVRLLAYQPTKNFYTTSQLIRIPRTSTCYTSTTQPSTYTRCECAICRKPLYVVFWNSSYSRLNPLTTLIYQLLHRTLKESSSFAPHTFPLNIPATMMWLKWAVGGWMDGRGGGQATFPQTSGMSQ